ncbi:UNVERIFIED_CONTAM: hypothetical protein FKN15_008346 [Acipenser sinensis]
MGCTPSKSPSAYQHGQAIRDSDTCSTVLPSLKSSCSTPLCSTASPIAEAPRQTFLRVPSNEFHPSRTPLQPLSPELEESLLTDQRGAEEKRTPEEESKHRPG